MRVGVHNIITIACCATAGIASAQDEVVVAIEPGRGEVPDASDRPDSAPAQPTTAAEVASAPRPDAASGRVDGADDEPSVPRLIGRTILAYPRLAFEIALAPVRGGIYAYDRFHLRERWLDLFFNDARTIGLYPTARVHSDFGVTVGARFVARDVLGEGEHVAFRAGGGGAYRGIVNGAVRSGDRFGRLHLELAGEWERRPRDRFYGIGNSDEVAATMATIDPLADATAVETRYRQQLARTSLIADVHVASDFRFRAAGALTDLEFGPGEEGTPIDHVYRTDRIVGFSGVRHAYGELELAWDSRGRSRWEPGSLDSIGSLLAVYAGRAAVADGADFWRVGGDAQHYLRLGLGPRVLATRLHVETVSVGVDRVPFDELPKLGGVLLLRGYPTDRFRDRAAALATVEYRWDLSWSLLAKLFVDAGRVAPSVGELSMHDIRVGYGFGIEAYGENTFVLRASVASSIDGGAFFYLNFDPAFELDPRVERR